MLPRCENCPIQSGVEVGACLPLPDQTRQLQPDQARFVLDCTVSRLMPKVVETHTVWDSVFDEQTIHEERRLVVAERTHDIQEKVRAKKQDILRATFLQELPLFIREGMNGVPYDYGASRKQHNDVYSWPDIAANKVIFPATAEGVQQWRAYVDKLDFTTPLETNGIGLMRTKFRKIAARTGNRLGIESKTRPISSIKIGERWLEGGGYEQLAVTPNAPNHKIERRGRNALEEFDDDEEFRLQFKDNSSHGFSLIKLCFSAKDMQKPSRLPPDFLDQRTTRQAYNASQDILVVDQVGLPSQAGDVRSASRLHEVTTLSPDDLTLFDVSNTVKSLFMHFNTPESALQHWTEPYRQARDIIDAASFVDIYGRPDPWAKEALEAIGHLSPYAKAVTKA